ncbi:zinc ABC transporter ATP-binding protein ZnuC [Endozoicomonas sp.]|uniref:zinc ABC transporter ATP-binding protein ZnuC n=1 Tax=Endozoicomonas sp. TaxID=1892382 RepID=UPI0028868C4F|nr:zinc ABC transporter ATP-binding protein ZnuC [Endozoicomonas sp.]
MNQPLIELSDIWMKFQNREVLTGVNLQVNPGEIVTLIGPNGAGKTTLVRIALGLQAPSSGQRTVKKGLRIGYMPQKLHINDSMPLTVNRFLRLTGCRLTAVNNALDRTGVTHVLQSPLQSLSGGELQRVLLARALLHKPHILVLDEPVQGVDITGQKALYQLITDLRNESRDQENCAVLMVSHDLHLVMASTDKVVCINQHVCCSGHPQQVKQHPAYLRLFGGESDELAIYTHHHDHHHGIDGHVLDPQKDCSKGSQ